MKKLCIISIISLLPFILLTSCGKKEDSINQLLPEVETGAITNMQSTSATLTGNAVFDKGFEITEFNIFCSSI